MEKKVVIIFDSPIEASGKRLKRNSDLEKLLLVFRIRKLVD